MFVFEELHPMVSRDRFPQGSDLQGDSLQVLRLQGESVGVCQLNRIRVANPVW